MNGNRERYGFWQALFDELAAMSLIYAPDNNLIDYQTRGIKGDWEAVGRDLRQTGWFEP